MLEFTEQTFIEFVNQNKIPMILTPPPINILDYNFDIICFKRDEAKIRNFLYYCSPVFCSFNFELVPDRIEYNQLSLLEYKNPELLKQ